MSSLFQPLGVVVELDRLLEGLPNWMPFASTEPLIPAVVISESLPRAEALDEVLLDDKGATRLVTVVLPPISRVPLLDCDNRDSRPFTLFLFATFTLLLPLLLEY